MRQAVISDLHLGDPYGGDLLRHRVVVERLRPLLERVDQLVLLGDTFELSFQQFGAAVEAARPLLQLIGEVMQGREVLILLGNHDYHLVSRAADELRERRALGKSDTSPFRVPPAERIIRHLAPGVKVTSAYPAHLTDGMCFTHGHYLSTHLEDLGWRSLDRIGRSIAGAPPIPAGDRLSIVEYEALIAPLLTFTYQVAQLPHGLRSQRQFELHMRRVAHLLTIPSKAADRAVRGAMWVYGRARGADMPMRPEPASTTSVQKNLTAMAQVIRNLELPDHVTDIVFAHTHQPLAGAAVDGYPWRFHNSGSWFYDHRMAGKDWYFEVCLPGSALEIIDGRVEVQQLLTVDDVLEFAPRRRRSRHTS